MICQTDPDKLSTYVNQAWCDFTGRTAEQEAGAGWARAVHPADVERCLAIYAAALHAGQDFELEYRLRRHDGEYRLVFDRQMQLRTDDDTLLGYVGGCVDITDSQDLTGQEREVRRDQRQHARRDEGDEAGEKRQRRADAVQGADRQQARHA